MACTAFSILNIVTIETQADGSQRTIRQSLLDGKNGVWLNDWQPSHLNYKGGGSQVNPPMTDGITPVFTAWDDVIDIFTISASQKKQDNTIKRIRDIGDLLIKAVQFWTTDWQQEPVWLEAKSPRETETRYAVIKLWQIPGHNNPYQNPFFNVTESALANVAMTITHEPWASIPPGQPCPDDRTEPISGCFPSYLEFAGTGNDNINCGSGASIDDLPDFAVAGKGILTIDGWIRADGYGSVAVTRILEKGGSSLVFALSNAAGLYGFIDCAAQNAISTSGLDELSADSTWHHVLMCYDETGAGTPAARTIYLAIDGVWVSSYVAQTPSIGNYTSDAAINLTIGNDPTLASTFEGLIGWVRISDNIRYDPAGGNFTPELRCSLPTIDANVVLQVIYEGFGISTYDRSGNDNDGTITGADWGCDCTYTDTLDVECNCVQISNVQEWPYDEWSANTNQPVNQVHCLIEAVNGTYLIAGELNTIWRINDGGTVWTAAAVSPAMTPLALLETSDGNMYCAGSGGVYQSTDLGDNWALRNAAATTNIYNSLVEFNGYIYLSRGTTVERSNDGGLTWNVVFTSTLTRALLAASDGYIYLSNRPVLGISRIYRSSDGTTWELCDDLSNTAETLVELSDGYMYAGDVNGLIYRSSNGLDWPQWGNIGAVPTIQGMILASNGRYYVVDDQGDVRESNDAITWRSVAATGTVFTAIVEFTLNSRIYVAGTGDIYWDPATADAGRDETCLDEVFVANKAVVAQITHVLVYDASTATYTSHYPASLPFFLLPSPFAANDAIYIGIEQAVIDSGYFSSLVFDILQGAIAATPIVPWEYYSSVGPAWAQLTVHDESRSSGMPFEREGVRSVHWVPPDDWTTVAINGITAYWVRVFVNAPGTWYQSPMQQYRDIYTVTRPFVEIDSDQVGGDIAALLRIKAHNRSDLDGYTTKTELDLMANRAIVALRETLRGEDFTCFINLAGDGIVANTYPQNPPGITVTDGTGTTTAADPHAPASIVCVHTTTGNGLTTYDDAVNIDFSSGIAPHYYGEFHAYVRAHLYRPSSSPVGDTTDVRVRLKIQTGSGGIIEYTDYTTFTGLDDWDAGAGIEERYNDFLLLDMGRVKLPVAGTILNTELPDQFTITVQIASDTSTNLRVKPYELILMPADEFIADFQDVAFEDDSAIDNGHLLDADSIYYLQPPGIRSLVRTSDPDALIKSNYEPTIAGPIFLQENAAQRLYFLFARAAKQGEHTGANNAATLTDAYADFIASGVSPGMIIYNVTDGSSATITDRTQTTVTGTLAGGVDDDWDTGDVYLIICPNWLSSPNICHSIQIEKRQRYLSMRGGS